MKIDNGLCEEPYCPEYIEEPKVETEVEILKSIDFNLKLAVEKLKQLQEVLK